LLTGANGYLLCEVAAVVNEVCNYSTALLLVDGDAAARRRRYCSTALLLL
jgi:hypothetical protein